MNIKAVLQFMPVYANVMFYVKKLHMVDMESKKIIYCCIKVPDLSGTFYRDKK